MKRASEVRPRTRNTVALAILVTFTGAACAESRPLATEASVPPATTTTTEPSTTVATTTSAPAAFTASVHDVIAQVNLQLPLLIEEKQSTPLPTGIGPDGSFGGQVTASTHIRLLPSGNAFEPVLAVVTRVVGSAGSMQTPARLLSGIGASLHSLSADAVSAFGRDALPRLATLTETRTTITVGTFYDLTITVMSPAELVFVMTPVGVRAPAPDTY